MSKSLVVTLSVLGLLMIVWLVWSLAITRGVESPAYKLDYQSDSGYEVRTYDSYLVAEVIIEGDFDEALNQGFRLIADYIFGNNTKADSIAMTTPVTENVSEPIAMTTPVTEVGSAEGNIRTIAFVMPAKYTLETIPAPNDSRVKLRVVPARKVATLTFGFYPSDKRVSKYKQKLVDLLKKDGVEFVGEPQFAGYNPPMSFPFLIKNEIQLTLSEGVNGDSNVAPVRSK